MESLELYNQTHILQAPSDYNKPRLFSGKPRPAPSKPPSAKPSRASSLKLGNFFKSNTLPRNSKLQTQLKHDEQEVKDAHCALSRSHSNCELSSDESRRFTELRARCPHPDYPAPPLPTSFPKNRGSKYVEEAEDVYDRNMRYVRQAGPLGEPPEKYQKQTHAWQTLREPQYQKWDTRSENNNYDGWISPPLEYAGSCDLSKLIIPPPPNFQGLDFSHFPLTASVLNRHPSSLEYQNRMSKYQDLDYFRPPEQFVSGQPQQRQQYQQQEQPHVPPGVIIMAEGDKRTFGEVFAEAAKRESNHGADQTNSTPLHNHDQASATPIYQNQQNSATSIIREKDSRGSIGSADGRQKDSQDGPASVRNSQDRRGDPRPTSLHYDPLQEAITRELNRRFQQIEQQADYQAQNKDSTQIGISNAGECESTLAKGGITDVDELLVKEEKASDFLKKISPLEQTKTLPQIKVQDASSEDTSSPTNLSKKEDVEISASSEKEKARSTDGLEQQKKKNVQLFTIQSYTKVERSNVQPKASSPFTYFFSKHLKDNKKNKSETTDGAKVKALEGTPESKPGAKRIISIPIQLEEDLKSASATDNTKIVSDKGHDDGPSNIQMVDEKTNKAVKDLGQTDHIEEKVILEGPSPLYITAEKFNKSRSSSRIGSRQGSIEVLAVERDSQESADILKKHGIFSTLNNRSLRRDSATKFSTFNGTRNNRISVDFQLTDSQFSPPPHFVVVAIDFGTTYSGYAFSFVRDAESVHMMRRWEGGDPGLINQKTPTILLLDPKGDFHSFGFTARDYFHDLDFQEAKKWAYFDKFKLALHHNADLNKDTTIKASNGKNYPAMLVFSHALRYFKDHALQELTDQSETNILNEDIRWVITVPAIWKAPAKQFMRYAAYKAGIASDANPAQLLIALEPEAASIYVRKLRLYQLVPDVPTTNSSPAIGQQTPRADGARRSATPDPSKSWHNSEDEVDKYKSLPNHNSIRHSMLMQPTQMQTIGQEIDIDGTRYMVVDCGGGTVDITVYEMEEGQEGGGYLKELHKATGGPFGSLGIDLEFERLLVSIFGEEFIESFKSKRPAGWVDLLTAFESRKRSVHPDKNHSLNVALPFSFIDYHKKQKTGSIDSAIKKFGSSEVSWSSQGMLRLTPRLMRQLFMPTIDKIKHAIGEVLNQPNVRGIKYLFLVGGFAESGILQQEIRKEFSRLLKVLIPQDVGTTILKGAVYFGLDPSVVIERRCRLTYGVSVLNRFIEGVHPQSKMVSRDGVKWCVDIFDKFVTVDQPVSLGETVVRSYAPARAGQKLTVVHVYSCERADVKYVTDPGVKKCGTLCLDLTEAMKEESTRCATPLNRRKRREIQAQMTFGDTEVRVAAVDVSSGKTVKAMIDFLGK